MTQSTPEKLSLSLKRNYDATPEEVWRAWTDPEALKIWFKPEEAFTIAVAEADVRIGGGFRVLMIDGDGKEHDVSGVYREVVPNQKLVMTWAWKSAPEEESLLTVTLRRVGDRTELQLRHEQFPNLEERESHNEGWNGSLTMLESFLASQR